MPFLLISVSSMQQDPEIMDGGGGGAPGDAGSFRLAAELYGHEGSVSGEGSDISASEAMSLTSE